MRHVKVRGPARMRQLKKTAVVIWLNQGELKRLDAVLRYCDSRAGFARAATLAAIDKAPAVNG